MVVTPMWLAEAQVHSNKLLSVLVHVFKRGTRQWPIAQRLGSVSLC